MRRDRRHGPGRGGGRLRLRLYWSSLVLGLFLAGPLAVLGNWASDHPEQLPNNLQGVARHPWWPFVACLLVAVVAGLAAAWPGPRATEIGGGAPASPEPFEALRLKELRGRVQNDLKARLAEPGEPEPLRLGLTARPDLVQRPGEGFAQRLAALPYPPAIGQLLEVGESALLIVGGPGSGKSFMLAQLASELLRQPGLSADEPARIPVLVELRSWTPPQPLAGWLSEELHNRFGVPLQEARSWVDERRILPLLDGLDENPHRRDCLRAINAFVADRGLDPLVVSCRGEDYLRLEVRLKLRAAVEIQPLTSSQVEAYLSERDVRWQETLAAFGDDGWQLLQSPLTLRLIAGVSRDRRISEVQLRALVGAGSTLEERRTRLLDLYVKAMLARRRGTLKEATGSELVPRWDREQAMRWLQWLARSMRQLHVTRFRLDVLHADWLPAPARSAAVVSSRIAAGLAVGLPVALLAGLVADPAVGLAVGLAGGLAGSRRDLSEAMDANAYEGMVWSLEVLENLPEEFAGVVPHPSETLSPEGRRQMRRHELAMRLAAWVSAGVAGGLVGLLAGEALTQLARLGSEGMFIRWVAALAGGLLGALHAMQAQAGELSAGEIFGWSRRRLPMRMLRLAGVMLAGLVLGCWGALVVVSVVALLAAFVPGMAGALIAGLIGMSLLAMTCRTVVAGILDELQLHLWRLPGYVARLRRRPPPTSVSMPQGTTTHIRRQAQRAFRIGLLALVVFWSLGTLLGVPALGLVPALAAGLVVGVAVGLYTGLELGGRTCIHHLALRALLVRSGCMPWRCLRFLDFAAERLILRRAFGAYEFIHPLLQEHLATTPQGDAIDQPPQRTASVLERSD